MPPLPDRRELFGDSSVAIVTAPQPSRSQALVTQLTLVLGISLSVSFMCSVLEAVLLSINRSFVGLLQSRGDRTGPILARMRLHIDEPIAAILTLNTIARTVGATLSGAIAADVFGATWVGVFSAALTFAILILAEIVPKTIGATFWKQLARPTAYLLQGIVMTMRPVLIPLNFMSQVITPEGSDQITVSRGELEVLAEIGRREGTIDEEEFQVMSNVMGLYDIDIGEVMTPRIDMIAVSIDASVAEAIDLMLDKGKLRLPVYEENLDQIVGILLVRDLWRADREGQKAIREIVRPAQFSPATKTVEDLIEEMREQRTKMVIVLDEFGGTAGLVTLEDLIEEIIGEIHDEHETDEPREFQELDDGRTLIWGGTQLRDVVVRLGVELDEEFDTVGGYVFGSLDRVGKIGDSVRVAGGELRIVKMRRRRIEYLVFAPAQDD